MSITQTETSFSSLNLPEGLLHKLARLGLTTPTPIQAQSIPVALTGRDLIGIAQTGTGKTLAFGLPMLSNLRNIQLGLVLAPTRELAMQIEETFNKLNVKTALLIGGAPMNRQVAQLRARPTVIVATPGRLQDHMMQRTVDLRQVAIVVLDEADRMLDMGFAPTIQKILDVTPRNRQTLLFSATMPKEIEAMAQQYMLMPERIEISPQGTVADRIEQELYVVHKEDKADLLREILVSNRGTVLVFARTRHGAARLTRSVRAFGHSAAELHSDRTLAQRKAALQGFKNGDYRVLIATDIAARGIDVKEIELVVNFDVPENPEDYVHRIGRTGRAGAEGRAITFATPDQHRDVRDIERLMKSPMPLSPNSSLSLPEAHASRGSRGPQRGGPRNNQGPRPDRGPRPERPAERPQQQGDRRFGPRKPGPNSQPSTPRPNDYQKPQGEGFQPKPEAPRTEQPKSERPRGNWTPKQFRGNSGGKSRASWSGPKPARGPSPNKARGL